MNFSQNFYFVLGENMWLHLDLCILCFFHLFLFLFDAQFICCCNYGQFWLPYKRLFDTWCSSSWWIHKDLGRVWSQCNVRRKKCMTDKVSDIFYPFSEVESTTQKCMICLKTWILPWDLDPSVQIALLTKSSSGWICLWIMRAKSTLQQPCLHLSERT